MINHIAFVMDGNRRWAKGRGWLPMRGHAQGVESAKKAIEFCLKKNIPHISLYTFSIENFKRSESEKSFLFRLLVKEAEKGMYEFVKKGVRIRFVGDRSLFPEAVHNSCQKLEEKTKNNSKLTVNILFCYGGQQEIVSAVRKIANEVRTGQLKEEDISEQVVASHLWTGDSPEPELIVRTGGAKRLSNFLLYQSAYSELCFLDQYWPAVTMEDLESVYEDFVGRKRRFGK